jgi:hypothetical protein
VADGFAVGEGKAGGKRGAERGGRLRRKEGGGEEGIMRGREGGKGGGRGAEGERKGGKGTQFFSGRKKRPREEPTAPHDSGPHPTKVHRHVTMAMAEMDWNMV